MRAFCQETLYAGAIKSQEILLGLSSRTHQYPGGTLSLVESKPASRPTLLFVHGLTGDRTGWYRLIHQLGRHVHVVAIDLPGHGASSYSPASDYGINFYVEVLKDFLQQRRFTELFLVGNSMGGQITSQLALEHPQLIDRLVLLNPSWLSREKKSCIHPDTRDEDNIFLCRTLNDYERFLERIMNRPPRIPAFARQHLARQHIEGRSRIRHLFQSFVHSEPLGPRWADGSVPTLLIWGREDQVLPCDLDLWKQNPHVTLKEYTGVGHLPQLEVPARVARDIRLALFAGTGDSA